jgi:hypothetical protein
MFSMRASPERCARVIPDCGRFVTPRSQRRRLISIMAAGAGAADKRGAGG